jgi:bifunctional non-homologous end joining protein LigD
MDRALYPETGFTKADAVAYYKAVSKYLLPHLRNRPISFKRYIDTVDGESFWEKDAPSFTPTWVPRFAVPRRGVGEDDIHYILVNNVRTLAWIAGIGGIELHPFLHVTANIDVATHVVFDLDPGEGADIRDCARVALLLRDALAAIHLQSFAKVSGSKGIQVYVPLNTNATHAMTELFARLVADELARRHPRLVVSEMSKSVRAKKVFIDWGQNADYKTTVAVYSLRATATPQVSMPVRWEELEKPKTLFFEPDEALARLRRRGDLFAPVLKIKQKLADVERGVVAARAPRAKPSGARTLPRPGSQSGRRLFVVVKTPHGSELRLEMAGRFRRWVLHRDHVRPAGEMPIDRAFYRGEVPDAEDFGAYEIIEGSFERKRFELWFSGRVLKGKWTLEKRENAWQLEKTT